MTRLATQDRFKITISGNDAFTGLPFDTLSGQEVAREVPKLRVEAGGAKIPMPTREELGNITVTKVYDQDTDGALWKRLAGGEKFAGCTITVQELDEDGVSLGDTAAVRYTDCVVMRASRDDADANGQDPLKLTIEWAIGGVA